MLSQRQTNKFWPRVSPWIFIGAVALLFPIFAIITMENINTQKQNTIRLLLEKGALLIRSFEAGTRTGMMGKWWDSRQLQTLLTETAMQADISHIIVTDRQGRVVAHNDPGYIGRIYGGRLTGGGASPARSGGGSLRAGRGRRRSRCSGASPREACPSGFTGRCSGSLPPPTPLWDAAPSATR